MKINLDKNKKYLLACSFGPDSMALFTMLLINNFNFEVAHVNYHMREESDHEACLLNAFCLQKDIIIHKHDAYYPHAKGNFQAWARNVRYDFFRSVVEEKKLDFVLTGHQQDDVIETYMMQKTSKREAEFFGIKDDITLNGLRVMRPLLAYTKQELIDFCKKNNTPFAIDKSNLESKYTRNYFRNKVLNAMTDRQRSEILSEIDLHNNVEQKLSNYVSSLIDKRFYVKRNDYQKLNEPARKRLLFIMLTKLNAAQYFTKGVFTQIDQTICSDKQTALFKLNGNINFSLAYELFTLIDISLYAPYTFNIERGREKFRSRFIDFDLSGNLEKYKINRESFPLTIRTFTKDDYYTIKYYRKKVSRLFIDMKLPKHLRHIWPLIIDKNGKIIYIPRYRQDYEKLENNKLNILL